MCVPVVAARRFFPDYRATLPAEDMALLGDPDHRRVSVLLIATSTSDGHWTANLRAPLVIETQSMTGIQSIAKESLSVSVPLVMGGTIATDRTRNAPAAPIRRAA